MPTFLRRAGHCLATLAAACTLPLPAAADDAASYPDRPVKVIVTYAPGGANDIIARLFADRLSAEFGQPFVVENRAGASGIPGTEAAARSPADGYTLVLGAGGTMTINPGLFKSLPYDPLASFAPVGLLARSPLVLVVPPALPVHDVKELLAYAGKQRQGLSFASPGAGTPLHLAGELFGRSAGIDMVHIPYRGSTPALNDVMAGRVDLMFDVLGSSMQFVRADRLRALAVTSATRSPQLPDVPTVAEQGVQGFDVVSWFAYFAPAGTPEPIIAKLNAAINKAVASPAMRERLAPMGMEPTGGTPSALRQLVQSEKAKWADVIAKVQIPPQ